MYHNTRCRGFNRRNKANETHVPKASYILNVGASADPRDWGAIAINSQMNIKTSIKKYIFIEKNHKLT